MAGNYKNFLRLLEQWPIDATKKKRDIGIHIRDQVKLNFASGGVNTPADQEKCNRMYISLKRFVDDHYKNLYSRSATSSATGLNAEQCKHILSDDFLEHLAQQRNAVVIKVFDKPYTVFEKRNT